MQLPELKDSLKAVDEGLASIKTELTKIYGSKDEVKQALLDYSSSTQNPKALLLLGANFLRFSDPYFEKLTDGLPTKSDFSASELQKMEQAFHAVMALAETMKNYAKTVSPDQIKYIAQDNPSPNLPRLLLWPLGTDRVCTEQMVEKIRADIGPENFKQLSSAMMLTNSAYEALYESFYLRRVIKLLRKDRSEEARQILAKLIPALTKEKAEQSYAGFMKHINRGEDEFVELFGPQLKKQDARVFFQGYARKYPFCLGILSSEYLRIKNEFK